VALSFKQDGSAGGSTVPEVLPVAPLPSQALYTRCDPDQFSFERIEELPEPDVLIGQDLWAAGVAISEREVRAEFERFDTEVTAEFCDA
jgi:hypothetical protein